MSFSLSNLPVGAKVKFGKYSVNGEVAESIIWLIVDKNHAGYPTNSVTLLTEKCIDLRCYDGIESNLPGQDGTITSGRNTYSLSNIDAWLNSSAVSWYVKKHDYDTPPSNANTNSLVGYDTRPGFLYNFTPDERNAILSTSFVVPKYSATTESLSRKIFLPSYGEVGIGSGTETMGDSRWAYFSSHPATTQLTQQAIDNTLFVPKPAPTANISYWSRNVSSVNSVETMVIVDSGVGPRKTHSGEFGVRPVLNLPSTVSITDTTDADGCYVVTFNTAPSAPAVLNVPTIYGGKTNAISWSNSTDLQGDVITYQLECRLNGNNFEQIYSGTSTVYAHFVPFNTGSVEYRVKAIDPMGESSAYTTSGILAPINNHAPVISGTDENLGTKNAGFFVRYTIADADSDVVTVTEAIDGVPLRTMVATLGETITFDIRNNTWLVLPNGSHTLTITANDGIDTTVRTCVFIKSVDTLVISNTSNPWWSSTMPTRIMLVVTRNLPLNADFKVEVCNNGFDTYNWVWEDATTAVKSGLVYQFTNKTKTADNWGVMIRVTVCRNSASGACYVSAIGGNFE